MALPEFAVVQGQDQPAPERLEKITLAFACAVVIAYVIFLAISAALRTWPYDQNGHLLQIDFAVFWTAGQLALHGTPHAAYVPHLIHAAEEQAVGHGFPANLPWGYPPLFLFVAVVLASFPFVLSFLLWNCTTLLAFGATVARITNRPVMLLAAAAAPWSLVCLHIGQDGLLSASLTGLVLLLLNQSPVTSGLLLGLLTFKPQLGILFPVALAFGRYWRVMIWACAGTLMWTGLSAAVFGFESLVDFFHGLLGFTDGFLVGEGHGWRNGLYNFQSIYALARWVGANGSVSWSLQAVSTAGCIAFLAALWRSNAPFPVKAAGLAAAIPVATPFVFIYDFSVLTIAIAFLRNHRRFDLVECLVIVFAVMITTFAWNSNPTGVLAPLAVCALVCRRVLSEGMFAGSVPTRTGRPESICYMRKLP